MGYRGNLRRVVQSPYRRPLPPGENMLCNTITTVRKGKIRNEPIRRSLLGSFNPVFMNIHASAPHLPRTHFSKRSPLSFATKFAKRTQAFATLNVNLNCIFINIDPFSRCARRLTYPKAMDYPTLIAGQPLASAEPRAVQLSYDGSAIKEARLAIDRPRQVGNLPQHHTSVVLESVPQSRPQPTQATASALWVKL
jgi:hypothetical protein